jgi:hypothetical protein
MLTEVSLIILNSFPDQGRSAGGTSVSTRTRDILIDLISELERIEYRNTAARLIEGGQRGN